MALRIAVAAIAACPMALLIWSMVADQRNEREAAAGILDDHGGKMKARQVDRRREAGGTGTDDEAVCHAVISDR
jgi:hypothetical protein